MSHSDNNIRQSLQVWYCEHCRQIHFKTQNVMLDFTQQEFVDLMNAMLEIFQNNFNPLDFDHLFGRKSSEDEILSSDYIT
jgi:hypothetical protein